MNQQRDETHAPEMAEAFVAAVLQDFGGPFAETQIEPHHLDDDLELMTIYAIMRDMHKDGIHVNMIDLLNEVKRRGASVSMQRVDRLAAADVFIPAWQDYETAVLKAAWHRRLARYAQDLAQVAFHGNGTAEADAQGVLRDAAAAVGLWVREPASVADPVDLAHCPPLPEDAQTDHDLARTASPTMDAYCQHSRAWAPRAYEDFHDAVFTWALSTIAAHRLRVHLGGERFTNLYIAPVARSSVFTKSTAHKIGDALLKSLGLSFLLASTETTPEALLKRMAGRRVIEGWDTLTPEQQEFTRLRQAFAGQVGWSYDEFGGKIQSMMREGSTMASFRGMFRKLDDCPDFYEHDTVGRGTTRVDRPYLALLASMTPADMEPFARRGGALWRDGFFARFAFVAPGPDAQPSFGRFPEGVQTLPTDLVRALRQWHERLGVPAVEVSEVTQDNEKAPKKWVFEVQERTPETVLLGHGVYEAYYRYHDALVRLANARSNTDLDGNYNRFAEKAVRVAALLASLENNNILSLAHWMRGQELAERWRQSLHNLYAVLTLNRSESAELEDRIVDIVERLGQATANQVKQRMRDQSTVQIGKTLEQLARAGVLHRAAETRKGTIVYMGV